MDRFIISHEFMSDLNKLPRSAVRLTASERYMYTGAEVAEDNTLPYEVCAGSLTKNISKCLHCISPKAVQSKLTRTS